MKRDYSYSNKENFPIKQDHLVEDMRETLHGIVNRLNYLKQIFILPNNKDELSQLDQTTVKQRSISSFSKSTQNQQTPNQNFSPISKTTQNPLIQKEILQTKKTEEFDRSFNLPCQSQFFNQQSQILKQETQKNISNANIIERIANLDKQIQQQQLKTQRLLEAKQPERIFYFDNQMKNGRPVNTEALTQRHKYSPKRIKFI